MFKTKAVRISIHDFIKELESPSGQVESSKKKRKTIGNEEFFFGLFKFPKAAEQYLLEMHEVKTGGIDRCHVCVYESDGRWKVGVYDLVAGDHVVLPVLQDPSPPMFPKKYELSLQERLIGWTVEKRKRGNGKEDKFYYHRGRQFRSFIEVTTFILYSCKLKDLQIKSTNETSQEVLEAEAAETMMIISSSDRLGNAKIGTCEENKKSAGLAGVEQERCASPFRSINLDDSFSSSSKTADDPPCVAEGGNIAEEKDKNEHVLDGRPDKQESEPEEYHFTDYISDIFEDDAPKSMSEIFGEPKL